MDDLIALASRTKAILATTLLCVITLGFPGGALAAGGTKYIGNYTMGHVTSVCANVGGTVTKGKGSGGFGCETAEGQVNCDKDGHCWGTCHACHILTHSSLQRILRPPSEMPKK
jgi:hypothetical protein